MDWERFIVKPGSKVRLGDIDTDDRPADMDGDGARELLKHNTDRLRELQERLYAENKHALLICLQAMDAGGKDGVIRRVLAVLNPQGCKVASFKQPTTVERGHDFMWRAIRDLPGRGEIAIFNRSHYEDVLVVRVKELVPEAVWSQRYDQINAIEQYLTENNTHIIKFFLHISKEEQLKRFKQRLDDPTKHWKISESDYTERERWDEYMGAFEDALSKCSTEAAPWFIIPSDCKWYRNLLISDILVSYLDVLDMKFPKPSVDIDKIRRQYYGPKEK